MRPTKAARRMRAACDPGPSVRSATHGRDLAARAAARRIRRRRGLHARGRPLAVSCDADDITRGRRVARLPRCRRVDRRPRRRPTRIHGARADRVGRSRVGRCAAVCTRRQQHGRQSGAAVGDAQRRARLFSDRRLEARAPRAKPRVQLVPADRSAACGFNGRLDVMHTGPYAGFGNNQMLCANPSSGETRRFLVGPNGCEITGVCVTPDERTMLVGIQHPGEAPGKAVNDPRDPMRYSSWPDGPSGGRPRSACIVITKDDGGAIGS